MQPVVDAATLAAGRLAFGLGSMAQENINGGTCGGATIQDDGSAGGANGVGFARVVFATVTDATNQSVTCAFHGTQRIASGPLTYTLPRANTLFNGFSFWVTGLVGTETIAPNAADNFQGVASGASIAIPQGSICLVTTNAASSGVWYLECNGTNAALTANASANALTITLNAATIPFRDPTLANGDVKAALPVGGLSITIPSGATLGTSSSNVPFRVWIFAAYNSGTPILGVATCSTATTIFGCVTWETIRNTAAGITAGSTSAGTLYTASAITNDAVRIIGYAEYASGLTTAGTWASNPTTLQTCLPPMSCPRPGAVVQGPLQFFTSGATTCGSSGTYVSTVLTLNITPTSAINLVRFWASGTMSIGNNNETANVQMFRNATGTGKLQTFTGNTAANTSTGSTLFGIDAPQATTSTTYVAKCTNSSSPVSTFPANSGMEMLEEIMGALPQPANDNSLLTMVG